MLIQFAMSTQWTWSEPHRDYYQHRLRADGQGYDTVWGRGVVKTPAPEAFAHTSLVAPATDPPSPAKFPSPLADEPSIPQHESQAKISDQHPVGTYPNSEHTGHQSTTKSSESTGSSNALSLNPTTSQVLLTGVTPETLNREISKLLGCDIPRRCRGFTSSMGSPSPMPA
ncbi:hypothetical protein K458DRAFT_5292 [Lentithecium fluviatile CBS 122367]|uniref:Uncharacterized protein n=1 Tax=Lentithecium fluviatile CBS 122367 TaxID=1168545 RepID=A0A6G1JMJ4_9PLEO|nr:hypothetical protein K458DRAFT_5292 [Lentithecium fluviatile CBS 122367]